MRVRCVDLAVGERDLLKFGAATSSSSFAPMSLSSARSYAHVALAFFAHRRGKIHCTNGLYYTMDRIQIYLRYTSIAFLYEH